VLEAVWLIPALPLAGFLILLVAGRRLGDPRAGWLATAMMGAAFLTSVIVFFGLVGKEGEERVFTQTLFPWIDSGSFHVDVAFLVDPLSITMALFVTGVGALIHLYAIGYMHGDEKYPKFFVYLNLFAFSMLMLVLADNFLLTFLGWEGVGACSYFLISFWFERDTAASAGKKAFVTNRIGDFGFMIAMFLIFATFGTLDYLPVLSAVEGAAEGTVAAIGLLLFLGAVGKSAQLPLYVWLPDAMEGPTPVSALIHAATMVTAGVFLMVRVNPVLGAADEVATLIAWVGVLTALFAATIACAQNDIKKVLAYSTISQLGYMFLAVGSGAYAAAIFHMVTHAFFKALLFLGAGSVIHGMHDEQDMKRMGGLRKWMPVTSATFIVGWLAIAGVPPFSGFWSKDDILLNAFEKSPVLWLLGLVTALLTAYYMSRQVFLVFYGDERWRKAARPETPAAAHAEPEHEPAAATPASGEPVAPAPALSASGVTGSRDRAAAHGAHGDFKPHESPQVMAIPLVVLAVLAALGGLLNLPFSGWLALEHWLEPVFGHNLHHVTSSGGAKVLLAMTAIAAAVVGVLVAAAIYRRHRIAESAVEPRILQRAWFVDELYQRVIAHPGRALSQWLASVFDAKVVDGAVNGVAALVRAGGSRLRVVQSGYVRNYALAVALGAVGILLFALVRSL
jgi:NADH-quinone oxidoreductase subunit L